MTLTLFKFDHPQKALLPSSFSGTTGAISRISKMPTECIFFSPPMTTLVCGFQSFQCVNLCHTHTHTHTSVSEQGSGACRKGPGHNRVSLSMDGRIPSLASVSLPLSPPSLSLSPLLRAAGRRQSSHQQSPCIISSAPLLLLSSLLLSLSLSIKFRTTLFH